MSMFKEGKDYTIIMSHSNLPVQFIRRTKCYLFFMVTEECETINSRFKIIKLKKYIDNNNNEYIKWTNGVILSALSTAK